VLDTINLKPLHFLAKGVCLSGLRWLTPINWWKRMKYTYMGLIEFPEEILISGEILGKRGISIYG